MTTNESKYEGTERFRGDLKDAVAYLSVACAVAITLWASGQPLWWWALAVFPLATAGVYNLAILVAMAGGSRPSLGFEITAGFASAVCGLMLSILADNSGSNAAYIHYVEERLEPVLQPGTSITEAQAFLRRKRFKISVKSQEQCERQLPSVGMATIKCLGGGYIHVQVRVKWLPIESTVFMSLNFDAERRLVGYDKRVGHTFL